MANKVTGHTFTRTNTKYPWGDWTNGDQWQIYKGDDYRISTYNMQISLHGRAKTQGLTVKSNSFCERQANGYALEGLVFQYYEQEQDAA